MDKVRSRLEELVTESLVGMEVWRSRVRLHQVRRSPKDNSSKGNMSVPPSMASLEGRSDIVSSFAWPDGFASTSITEKPIAKPVESVLSTLSQTCRCSCCSPRIAADICFRGFSMDALVADAKDKASDRE